MKSAAKKYNTSYKKKVDVERDPYLPKRSPKEIIQCSGCGAFYVRRHWTLNPPGGFICPVHIHPIYCPACRKIGNGFRAASCIYWASKLQADRRCSGSCVTRKGARE